MRRTISRLLLVPAIFAAAFASTASAKDGEAIALANGKPVSREAVLNLLLESHGIEALQQILLLDLARQEAERRGIKVTQADVQREYDSSVERLARAAAAGAPDGKLTDADKRRALDLMLEQKGLSHAEFSIGMERNAYLRKLVETQVKITDATLREEFARTYGERVQIRDIVIADAKELTAAMDALNKGMDFAEVAKRFSQHPSAPLGGQFEPFTFDDDRIPALVRESAFGLRPGEVSSPLRVEERFHIVKLEQRLAPENVKFDDVKAQVEDKLRDRVIPQEMSKLAAELFEKAQVKVLEPKLKDKFEELKKQAAQQK